MKALTRLGDEVLEGLLDEGVSRRIDDEKVMHVRIRLSNLARGEIVLISEDDTVSVAKGQFKIESYPGSEPSDVIAETILLLLNS